MNELYETFQPGDHIYHDNPFHGMEGVVLPYDDPSYWYESPDTLRVKQSNGSVNGWKPNWHNIGNIYLIYRYGWGDLLCAQCSAPVQGIDYLCSECRG